MKPFNILKAPRKELLDFLSAYEANPKFEGDLSNPKTEWEVFYSAARWICLNDLFFFCKYVLNMNLLYLPLHGPMCKFIEQNRYGLFVCLMPRGTYKTTILAIGGVLQMMLRHPDWNILLACIKHDTAKKRLSAIRMQCEGNHLLRMLFRDRIPDKPKDSRKWTAEALTFLSDSISHDATLETTGTDVSITGSHYNLRVYDDVIDNTSTKSSEEISKSEDWYEYTRYLSKDSEDGRPGTGEWILGTRYHFDDLYGYIKRKASRMTDDRYKHKFYERSILEGPHVTAIKKELYSEDLEDSDDIDFDSLWKDTSIFPTRRPKEMIRNEFLSDEKDGSFKFYCQQMNLPIDPKQQVFRRQFTRYYDSHELPNLQERKKFILVDPSVGRTESADNTVILVVYVDYKRFWWIGRFVRERLTEPEIIETIIDFYFDGETPEALGIENVAFQENLRTGVERECEARGIEMEVTPLKPRSRQKDSRIRSLQHKWGRREIMCPNHDHMREVLTEEIYRYPNSRRKDFLDALAYTHDIVEEFGYPDCPIRNINTGEVVFHDEEMGCDFEPESRADLMRG